MAALLQAAKIKGIIHYHVATASNVSATVLRARSASPHLCRHISTRLWVKLGIAP